MDLSEDLLRCPICLEIPEKEIYQCRNGHGICSLCLSKSVRICPQCRDPLDAGNAIRNRSLEAILDAMTFDCPQKEKGCKEKVKRKDITSHLRKQCKHNYNKSNPRHFEVIENGLSPGSTISIVGKPWPDADRFSINIDSKAEDDRILFHFDARFDPPYASPDANVVRNTYFNIGWGHEERYCSKPFPFTKDKSFKIQIWCEMDRFHVAVDGKSYTDYKYRIPLEHGRNLRIIGGVDITEIVVT